MIKTWLLSICLIFTTYLVDAQNLKGYQSIANKEYWKNRKPDADYWQQDVHYTIDATVDETTHIISATQQLDYWNNSPDTLTYVYFHLFQNAFVKGSYLHNLEEEQKVGVKLGKYEAAGLGTVVENIKVDGQVAKVELDNTILKVFLNKPLYPNSGVTLSMNFRTYFDNGSTRRRMKMYPAWGFMHYNGVQWFPKVCVYDRKFGWDTYQHLNKEFYGDFGIYDVSLNFASNYIVEATGILQNRKDVLPDDLREKIDVKHFGNKPWNEAPSIIIPYEKGKRKTWHYHAENVHDFAFTADPSYRLSTSYWKGVECVGIVQEPHASGWQNSGSLVAKIIEQFSNDIGMYGYPKMVAADAADGMEYPMLTLDGGSEPGYRGLLVHEIGHNWFYGMLGSNETYRAAMDEGFTQFITSWGLNKIDGKYIKEGLPKSKYRRHFYQPTQSKDARVFNSYLYTALNGEPKPINTHSNDFNDALGHEGGYGMVYFKTATMLYNLQYVLGDSLFQAAFQHYFHQWKFAHPYFEDFRASIIQFTHVDLNWFFDEWFETTKTIDYRIDGMKRIHGTDSFNIRFQRVGDMQMPIDFTVTANDGTQTDFHIPNTWFTKQTNAILLPKWYGWSKIQPRYNAIVYIPSGIKSVQIDTSNRIADIYPLDNNFSRGIFPRKRSWQVKLDGGVNSILNRRHYQLWVRPDFWWNAVDGLKLGVHAEGDYLRTMHRFEASLWWNTHALQEDNFLSRKSEGWYSRYAPINFSLDYVSPVSPRHPEHEEQINIRFLDGLAYGRIGHNWIPNKNTRAEFFYQTLWRPNLSFDKDYLLYPQEWSSTSSRPNNSLNIVLSRSYQGVKSVGSAVLTMRAPLLTGNDSGAFNYGYIQINHLHNITFGKLTLRTRFFARVGTGTSIPYESALWLSGANPEDLMNNKYTRSVGYIPDEFSGISRYETNHFQMGGGLNLRGYAGYFVADERNGEIYIGYKGRSGAAINVELDVDNYIKLQPRYTRNWLHVDLYGFADCGIIELSKVNNINNFLNATPSNQWSDLRLDAGIGAAFTIKKWGVFDKAKPLTIRFDVPCFINRPPYAAPQYFGWRYVVGINRAF
ncbi:MAG: M1 family metallopeptidase [Bacteroidetes bacterium]|nr:M1 family metallopeptidase [Bacteroidota bacterium]